MLPAAAIYRFGPFRLEPSTGVLWHEEHLLPLAPKPLAVLTYLVSHAGEVVSKDALLSAVWPDTAVTEGVLKTCLGQIRQALGETARQPQHIVTVHRRGYRFIAPVTAIEPPPPQEHGAGSATVASLADTLMRRSATASLAVISARESELEQLQGWWLQALQGTRQTVFVTGEAGIGKTTVVEAFVAQVAHAGDGWIGYGQCIEQYGAGEAYLPLLEAIGRLGRGPAATGWLDILRRYAPNWLLQLPALVSAEEAAILQRQVGNTSRERMLRELTEAVEAVTVQKPMLLILEDLHWSDASTVDWLAYQARRRETARLLVVGTYRPVEAIVRTHPIRPASQELLLHRQCAELPIGYLPLEGIERYLAQRFDAAGLREDLSHALQQRTAGNPLFLVTVVDELVRQGVIRQGPVGWELVGKVDAALGEIPESVRQLLERQVEQLEGVDQELLEAASVAGAEFSAAVVAAGVERGVEDVETHYDAMVRRGQFVSRRGTVTWPDGTVSAHYGFLHDLYRETLYGRVPVSRRGRWHHAMGRRLEAGYGAQARELAAELAEHFVRGRDHTAAVQYFQYAAEQAVQRSAHQEARRSLTSALELLARLPESPARAQQELDLRLALGPVLMVTASQGATEVERTYARARVLCTQVGQTAQLLPTLQGLCEYYRNRGLLHTSRELGEQLCQLAEGEDEPHLRLEAQVALGTTLFHLGEYAAGWAHLKQALALIDPTAQPVLALRHGVAPGVRCLALAANTLWCLGFPAQARGRSEEALALAQAMAHPYSLALARHFAAFLHHRRGEASAVQTQADALLTLATTQGFPLYIGYGTCYRGWALAAQGQSAAGLAQIRQGFSRIMATGLELSRPLWCILLAEVAGQIDPVDEGGRLLAEALKAFETSERGDMRAEAYRLQGEWLLRQGQKPTGQSARHTEAEACFRRALTLARQQQAKAWELRAALSLGRLWQHSGRRQQARELLAGVYDWFSEGFDTVDLQAAKVLLADLA